jgi:hypothetical protein
VSAVSPALSRVEAVDDRLCGLFRSTGCRTRLEGRSQARRTR